MVTIQLFGQLSPGSPRHQSLEWNPGMMVRDAAQQLAIPPEEIGLITINGVQSELEDPLPAGCRLCFFPYVSGG